MKLAILTCLWKRPFLSSIVLQRFAAAKAKFGDIDLIAIGSEGPKTRSLAEQHGWHYADYNNDPLSRKWQYGLSVAKERKADAVLIVGSDDWISDQGISKYMSMMRAGHLFVGLRDLYFYRLAKKSMIHWKGYEGDRAGEPIGLGRCLHRELLDRMGWNMWREDRNRALDLSAWSVITRNTSTPERKISRMANLGVTAVALKGSVGITRVEHIKGKEVDAFWVLDAFDQGDKDRLNNLIRML